MLAAKVFKTSVARTKALVPASEVPKWAEVLSHWRKDFSAEDVEHRDMLRLLGLVAYEIAVLRWSIVGSPFLAPSKSPAPDFMKYVGYLNADDDNPSTSTEEPELTREEFAKLSEEEKQKYREEKSAKAAAMWGVLLKQDFKRQENENEHVESQSDYRGIGGD